MSVQLQFKKYEVITANTAEQMGLSITALLLADAGWRVSTPVMCVPMVGNGLHYYVGMTQFEAIQTPDQQEAPALAQ